MIGHAKGLPVFSCGLSLPWAVIILPWWSIGRLTNISQFWKTAAASPNMKSIVPIQNISQILNPYMITHYLVVFLTNNPWTNHINNTINMAIAVELTKRVCEKSVLISSEATPIEYRQIRVHSQCHSLMLMWSCRVLERHVPWPKSISGHP